MTTSFQESEKTREYVQRFIGNLLGRVVSFDNIEPALAESCFYALTRQEELDSSIRDRWGNWDWQFCDAQRRGELYIPWLDKPLVLLRDELERQHPEVAAEPLWPDGKSFALCLTHDLDEVSPCGALRTRARSVQLAIRAGQKWPGVIKQAMAFAYDSLVQRRPPASSSERRYEDWLKPEDKHGFKSTFFFFPSRLGRPHIWDCTYRFSDKIQSKNGKISVAEMLREIDRAGWEVGLHGSYHSATEPGLLKDERRQVEEALGHRIISIRQHYLHYDVGTTPRLQADAGLTADSTQGFNRCVGFRAGTSFPYWCWDHKSGRILRVLEIPQIIMDGALFQPNSLEYDEETAVRHSLQIMEAVERVGGCLTLNWHPNYLNDNKWWNIYKTLLEEAGRRNAWGCSVKQLYKWWTAREQRIYGSLPGLDS
jgi:peptidoglycan/xylan/chitin deacetylase (PgdA/CDA1 family)